MYYLVLDLRMRTAHTSGSLVGDSVRGVGVGVISDQVLSQLMEWPLTVE